MTVPYGITARTSNSVPLPARSLRPSRDETVYAFRFALSSEAGAPSVAVPLPTPPAAASAPPLTVDQSMPEASLLGPISSSKCIASFIVSQLPPQSNTRSPSLVLIASMSAIIWGVMSVSARPPRTSSPRAAWVCAWEYRTGRRSDVLLRGLVFQFTSTAMPYEWRLGVLVPEMLRQL